MNNLIPVLLDTQKKMGNFPEKYNLTKLTQEEGEAEFPTWGAVQVWRECRKHLERLFTHSFNDCVLSLHTRHCCRKLAMQP